MEKQKFVTADADVYLDLENGILRFDSNYRAFARKFLIYESLPDNIELDNIENIWLDSSGYLQYSDLVIECSDKKVKLRVDQLGSLESIIPSAKGENEAENLISELEERKTISLNEKDDEKKPKSKKKMSQLRDKLNQYTESDDQKETKTEDNSNKKEKNQFSVKELKRTCKSCGNVWHVEKKEIQDLKEKKKENAKKSKYQGLLGAPSAGNMAEKNKQDAIQRLKELNKCPECRSSNYKEEKVRPEDLEEPSKANNSDEDVTEDNQDDENTSEVNYCPQCGEEINEDEASFCKNCGTNLDL